MSSPPDYRISVSTVVGMDDDHFCWTIIENAWPDIQEPDVSVKLKNSTKGQRAILAVTMCQREVDNGGFEQFFQNGTGDITEDVFAGFGLLGIIHRADLVRRARQFFPAGVVIEDRQSRGNHLRSIPPTTRNAFFDPLDKEFYLDSEPKLYSFFRDYVDRHPDDFFR